MTLAELMRHLVEARAKLPDASSDDIRVRVMDAENGYAFDLQSGGLQTESSTDTATIWLQVTEA